MSAVLRRYLSLWLALSSAAALWQPELASWLGATAADWDPFIAGKATIGPAIVVTMFCVGALLPADEVRLLWGQGASVLFGTLVQYITMPLLAWLAAGLWGLTGDVRLGVLIVGCVPGAMASNVLTLAARGNVSYSIGLTTSATLLSPVIVPVALKLTGGETISNAVLWRISLDLVWTVVLPVLAGFAICRYSVGVRRVMERVGEVIANVAILWIIAVVVGAQRGVLRSGGAGELLAELAVALLAINGAGYLAGYLAGAAVGLDERRRRALTIEVGMQNAGVGTHLAMSLLGGQTLATIPTAMYTFGCMLTGALLAQAFAWHSERQVSALSLEGGDAAPKGPAAESAPTAASEVS